MALQAALKSPDFELSHWISSLELDPLLSKSDSVSKILSELEHIAARLQTELDLGLDQASKDVVKLSHRVQGLDSNLITAQGKLDEICSTVVVENHQDAENWSSITKEMDALLVADDFDKASRRLHEASRSLSVVKSASDLDARKAVLDTIQSRFVNTLQDALRKAWQNKDHNTTQQIFGNFKLIGLSADFLQIWSGMIMAPIVKEMSLILEQYKSTRKFSFEQFSRFIRSFSDVSREQREYSINYFDAENFEILLQNGFLAITPMFNQFLALISSDFECIVQVYEITSSSILKLHLEFQKFVSNQTLHNFMALFVTHQKRYITMETNFLELALEKIESDFSTFSSQLLLDTAKSATDRCRVFTHWTAATSFSHCISDYFVRAVALFIRDLRSKNIIVPSQKAVSDMIYLSESDWASSYERANHLSSSVVLYQAITSFQDSVLGDLSLKVPSENVESVSSLFHLEELRKSLFSELSLNPALLEALGRLEGYVNQCQRDIVDSLVIHIKPHMEKITSIIWCESGTDTGALPKFSLSPNPFITTIGEYLLTLPQQLDALMQNENLSFRAIQLPNLITEDVQDFSGDNSQFAAEVGHLWISSIVRTVESLLISKFLAITKLSESGTKQLLTDIGYFNNILAALEIEMHSEFKLMLELLNCPADQFISTIENHKEKAIVSKIAEMRSIQI